MQAEEITDPAAVIIQFLFRIIPGFFIAEPLITAILNNKKFIPAA